MGAEVAALLWNHEQQVDPKAWMSNELYFKSLGDEDINEVCKKNRYGLYNYLIKELNEMDKQQMGWFKFKLFGGYKRYLGWEYNNSSEIAIRKRWKTDKYILNINIWGWEQDTHKENWGYLMEKANDVLITVIHKRWMPIIKTILERGKFDKWLEIKIWTKNPEYHSTYLGVNHD